jgi:glycosyltransferase involved in cell wall biosynthesis
LDARADVQEFLSTINVFVMPSLWEGQPIALLEALAIGKPTIISCVDGIPEIISDGVNDYLVKPKDVSGLIQAMKVTTNNPANLQKFAHGGAKEINQKFLAQNMTKAIAGIYLGFRKTSN